MIHSILTMKCALWTEHRMEVNDTYDYSVTSHHLQPFVNPFGDEPFISEMEDSFGQLWEFKKHISRWSFGVNRWKKYVFLRYKVEDKPGFLTWNINEKVMFIDAHHEDYVVLVLREVDDTGKSGKHCHSIVMSVHSNHAQFDLETLMTFLEGSNMESLNNEFVENGYVPWKNGTAKSNARKLSLIFQTLDRYALANVQVTPSVGGSASRILDRPPRSSQTNPTQNSGGRSRGTQHSQPMSESRKRDVTTSSATESTRKRKKNTSGAGASGSALTTVETVTPNPPMAEFQRYAQIQRDFWANHKQCFLFDQNTVTVDIKQCFPAREQYVIRAIEESTLSGMKDFLVQLIDVKQRQKVCLTPVDMNMNLLRRKPEKWEDIKRGAFMIINGQHSITASKQLQIEGCCEERKVKLQRWDAYIVWTLDANKLRAISKFYNATNHLDHAQPTWGNQIISCRNIWIACGRPSEERNEHVVRKNQCVFDKTKYEVELQPLSYRRLDDMLDFMILLLSAPSRIFSPDSLCICLVIHCFVNLSSRRR